MGAPSWLPSPPSSRCGSPSRSTTSAAPPSSTASASKRTLTLQPSAKRRGILGPWLLERGPQLPVQKPVALGPLSQQPAFEGPLQPFRLFESVAQGPVSQPLVA